MNKEFKMELEKHLDTVSTGGAELGMALQALDSACRHPAVQADRQLMHFLERRSYQKAREYLSSLQD